MGRAVSRGGVGDKSAEARPKAGTPIWVWLVYGVGILAAAIIVFSVLFTAGAYFLGGSGYSVSPGAFVLWGGLYLVAVVTFLVRRRNRR